MSLSSAISRDIVTARFLFNTIKGNRYQDTLRDAVVGDFKWSARTQDFSGWLICDGRSLNRTEYSQLYEIIGTSFGSSSSSTFKLPDCRGKVSGAIGQGSGLTNRAIGDVVGTENHTLSVNQIPSHTHTGTTDASGTHTHNTNADGGQGGLGLVTANGYNTVIDTDFSSGELNVWTTPYALTVDNAGSHTHTFTTNATGGGQSFNIMQPTVFIGHVFIYTGILEPNEPQVYTQAQDDTEYNG